MSEAMKTEALKPSVEQLEAMLGRICVDLLQEQYAAVTQMAQRVKIEFAEEGHPVVRCARHPAPDSVPRELVDRMEKLLAESIDPQRGFAWYIKDVKQVLKEMSNEQA